MVAVARMAGLGGKGSGLLVAVWPDGRIIRARDAALPETDYVQNGGAIQTPARIPHHLKQISPAAPTPAKVAPSP